MTNAELIQQIPVWSHDVLAWIGFGTLAGLCAKAIMPGRDPGGAIATMAMGLGGLIIGQGAITYFWTGTRLTAMSPLGLAVATAGAFLILAFYRMLSGYWFVEDEDGATRPRVPRHRRRTRRYEPVSYD